MNVPEPGFDDEIDLVTGTDATFEWWWLADGVGVDFTGCTGAFAARICPTDPSPLFSGTVTLGTAAGGNVGLVQLTVPRTNLAAITLVPLPPVAHGDLEITESDGTILAFAHLHANLRQGNTY